MDDKDLPKGAIPEEEGGVMPEKKAGLVKTRDRANVELRSPDELRRYRKPIIMRSERGKDLDESVISMALYNSFNYAVLPDGDKPLGYSIGITSAGRDEGKTTSACNFAISLSLGSRRKTVLVDMNLYQPRLHEIFGVPKGPGVVEALAGEPISLAPSQVDNLYILSAGDVSERRIGLAQLASFKDIVESILMDYEILIVDLPSLDNSEFPTVFCNQLNGLLVVVEIGKTRRRDVERVFRKVHANQILGFIMNKVDDEKL